MGSPVDGTLRAFAYQDVTLQLPGPPAGESAGARPEAAALTSGRPLRLI